LTTKKTDGTPLCSTAVLIVFVRQLHVVMLSVA
jgi:hypothetical protein